MHVSKRVRTMLLLYRSEGGITLKRNLKVNKQKRILTLDSLITTVKVLRKRKRKIVLTSGCFDIIHLGHVKILEMAHSIGDVLIVGLNSDSSVRHLKGHGHPIMPEMDRAEIIGALRCVDYVTIFSEMTAENLIRNVKPNVYVKGGDYEKDYEKASRKEMAAVKEYGGEVIVLPYVSGKSSTLLVKKILKLYANNELLVNAGGDT